MHFATGLPNRKEPYNAFLIDEFKEWQECQTGKNFGSAYGDECIWQRWANYAKDGHGGNVELTEKKKNLKI